jgi:hypothetical protein
MKKFDNVAFEEYLKKCEISAKLAEEIKKSVLSVKKESKTKEGPKSMKDLFRF